MAEGARVDGADVSARSARRRARRVVLRTDEATAGSSGSVGFTTLAMFWLYSGARAYIAIRRGNVQVHRRWMLRNYALTFGAATLRIELPLLIMGGLSFHAAYTMVAWISWVPNWLAVEAWLRKGRAPPR